MSRVPPIDPEARAAWFSLRDRTIAELGHRAWIALAVENGFHPRDRVQAITLRAEAVR